MKRVDGKYVAAAAVYSIPKNLLINGFHIFYINYS